MQLGTLNIVNLSFPLPSVAPPQRRWHIGGEIFHLWKYHQSANPFPGHWILGVGYWIFNFFPAPTGLTEDLPSAAVFLYAKRCLMKQMRRQGRARRETVVLLYSDTHCKI